MKKESETGKIYISGVDKWGRPVVIFDNSVQNTNCTTDQLNFLSWNLEYACRMMPLTVDKYVVFMNLEMFSIFATPSMAATKESIFMLCSAFPERLGHCVCYKPPSLFHTFFNTLKGLIDPRTANKMVFITGDVSEGSPNDNLMRDIIGDDWKTLTGAEQPVLVPNCSPGYDHSVYWPMNMRRLKEVMASECLKIETYQDNDSRALDASVGSEADDGEPKEVTAFTKPNTQSFTVPLGRMVKGGESNMKSGGNSLRISTAGGGGGAGSSVGSGSYANGDRAMMSRERNDATETDGGDSRRSTMTSASQFAVAPVWDEASDRCVCCFRQFGVIHRCHHCRQCGATVCSACSRRRVVLGYARYRGTRQRVCDNCFDEIVRDSNSFDASTPTSPPTTATLSSSSQLVHKSYSSSSLPTSSPRTSTSTRAVSPGTPTAARPRSGSVATQLALSAASPSKPSSPPTATAKANKRRVGLKMKIMLDNIDNLNEEIHLECEVCECGDF